MAWSDSEICSSMTVGIRWKGSWPQLARVQIQYKLCTIISGQSRSGWASKWMNAICPQMEASWSQLPCRSVVAPHPGPPQCRQATCQPCFSTALHMYTIVSRASPFTRGGRVWYGTITRVVPFSPEILGNMNMQILWRLYASVNHNSAHLADKHRTGCMQTHDVQWLACHHKAA